jgi:DNA-directed RNA polymerase subunit RPC12/RpoP
VKCEFVKGAKPMAQNHKCQICAAEFDNEAKLEDHNRTMHSEYKCEECGQAFHSKSDFETHYRDMHPERAGSPTR